MIQLKSSSNINFFNYHNENNHYKFFAIASILLHFCQATCSKDKENLTNVITKSLPSSKLLRAYVFFFPFEDEECYGGTLNCLSYGKWMILGQDSTPYNYAEIHFPQFEYRIE